MDDCDVHMEQLIVCKYGMLMFDENGKKKSPDPTGCA